ncbi:BlaR1 family beta-lactam sensor/signal transducer [Bacillus haynesii]|uniref:BlaR1 family beta-lactam sensor/signal transducer n=1 Tax=Bacillus haynesii TaxID=1925021 RepID=UPI0022806EB0|nr:BlaR1 family beta-lactam sensor/signal transducer [Bacillus haynesii]MCY8009883.1 BlaR1 family beta-lactam sensor/signal transducer [Bacillus haynesii]
MSSSFFIPFLVSQILLSLFFSIIILIKKLLKAHITVRTHYHLSVISLLALIAPFIPFHFLKSHPFDWILNLGGAQSAISQTHSTDHATEAIGQQANWVQDFSISIEQSPFKMIDSAFFAVWIFGIAVMLIATLYSNLKIGKIKKSLQMVNSKELLTLFRKCKEDIRFHQKVILGCSPLIKSPITFGVIRPYIILPKDTSMFSADEMKCVLLHELYHCKRKDMFINYFLCLSRIVYWFNPLVWHLSKEAKTEMEISCDFAVLKTLDKKLHLKYGEVILKFTSLKQRTSSLLAASEFSSSYKHIKRRIVTVVNFQAASPLLKVKSAVVFALVLGIMLAGTPSVSILAMQKETRFLPDTNVEYEDYSTFFDEFSVSGGFVLFDSNRKKYTIYNRKESTARFAPASTYKVFSALLALESGIITKNNSHMTWDGTQYPYKEWNQDQDLFSAMSSSATWYFQKLDRQIGEDHLRHYLKSIHYGNEDFSDPAHYWLDGSLQISPLEQVNILKKFYDNEFDFKQSNIQTVKDSIRLEKSNGRVLSGKTGTSVSNGDLHAGWFIGYVETADNTFFFAVHIQGEKQAAGSSAAEIALSILDKKGIYPSASR